MPYFIAIYDWSLYTLPSAIPMSDIEGDTHSNHPDAPDYSSGAPSWIGETFTFNGGAATLLEIDDDDGDFEDAYVETGGAQTLAQDVVINGTLYLAGSVVENEFSMLDASGNEIWVVRIDGVNVGFTYPYGEHPTVGQTFTGTVGRDGDPADSSDGQGTIEPYSGVICFTPGALIDTPDGRCPVERLRPGDVVTTLDNGVRPIRWVSRRVLSFDGEIDAAKPVEIKAGAFAPGYPGRDLVVSPQHRFLVHDRSRMTASEVLVPAKALTDLPRVRQMRGKKSVEYIHLALDRHEVIFAENLATESCYVGPVVVDGLSHGEKADLAALFPGVDPETGRGYGPTARPVLKVQAARHLMQVGYLFFGDSRLCPDADRPDSSHGWRQRNGRPDQATPAGIAASTPGPEASPLPAPLP